MEGLVYQTIASMGLEGKDATETAMAKTVGLPLGIAAKCLLHKVITKNGLLLPLTTNIYKPILKELSSFGIQFQTISRPLDRVPYLS